MENVKLVKDIMQGNDLLTSLDLKDAYFSIPMCSDHHNYLTFSWENVYYAFTCLPFGLSSAPRIFTKVMKPVLAVARSEGICLVIFLDDILIMASSVDQSLRHTTFVMNLLESLGFVINRKKSCLTPQTRLCYLGFEFDSSAMTLRVPESKIEKLQAEDSRLLSKTVISIRDLARVIGMIVSTFEAFPEGKLHFRQLEYAKIHALQTEQGSFEGKIEVTPTIIREIQWWLNLSRKEVKSAIKIPPIDLILCTDASKTGWGAICETDNSFSQGKWTSAQQHFHINRLELTAVYKALCSLCSSLYAVHVLIKSDNSTAVSYLSKMGGSVGPLNDITLSIFEWCAQRNILLSATHVAGIDNFLADSLSRKDLNKEMNLQPNIFAAIVRKTIRPTVDLFASHTNHKLEPYVSWKADPHAWAIDAFSLSWADMTPYIFPPFCLLSRILDKIARDGTPVCLLIAPIWKAQPWFPQLLQMLIARPLILPPECLLALHQSQHHVPNLRLAAWVISSNTGKQEAFQQTLPVSSQVHGGCVLKNNTSQHGTVGLIGVIHNRLIHSLPL